MELGDWEFSALDEISLGNKAQTRYEKATKDSKAEDYTPVAVLAKQIVSGTNYAYLCETPDNTWHIVVVYESLKNKYSVASNKEIDIAEVETTNLNKDEADEESTGAWEICMPDAPGTISEPPISHSIPRPRMLTTSRISTLYPSWHWARKPLRRV